MLALLLVGLAAGLGNGAPGNDTIVQLFQWRWTDVAAECCDFLGPQGFDAVQISPPTEQITASQWWASYQPVSYQIGNRLGDMDAFKAMIADCQRCGVKIIAGETPLSITSEPSLRPSVCARAHVQQIMPETRRGAHLCM